MSARPALRHLVSLALLGLVALIGVLQLPPFNLIALKLADLNFALHDATPNSEVVLVTVDEKSVNRYGRWPWDRRILAHGLERLEGASVVVLDMVLSEPTTVEADTALAEQIVAMDNVICGFFFRNEASEGLYPGAREVLRDSSLERVDLNHTPLPGGPYLELNTLPLLESCAANAAFSTVLDDDALTRRYPLALNFYGELYPSLGVQALRFHLNRDLSMSDAEGELVARLGEQRLPAGDLGLMRLNFYPRKSYREIPFVDLAEGRVPADQIDGKIVILGISEAGVTDLRASPLGNTPGPLMHYTFIANVLDGAFIKQIPWLDGLALLLLGLLPLLARALSEGVLRRSIIYVTVAVAFVLIGKLAYLFFGLWLEMFYPLLALLVLAIYNETDAYRRSEEENRFITEAFSSYVSPQLLKVISGKPKALSLGGEERNVTLLFSDIRSFTTISEGLDSTRLVQLLNTYFDPLTRVILDNGGMLDKYIGDAIMAIFNAPVDLPNHPTAAARSALEMIRTVERLNHQLEREGLPAINIGVGLNSGGAVVGNMGSSLRFNYTAIGDTVNLASRLEGQTKNYRCRIIVSEFTAERLDDEFLLRRLDKVKVKGKNQAVRIYELMENTERNQQLKDRFKPGLELFDAGDFDSAEAIFRDCAEAFSDPTSEIFIDKCREAKEVSV